MGCRCNDKTHRNKNVQQFVTMENKKIIRFILSCVLGTMLTYITFATFFSSSSSNNDDVNDNNNIPLIIQNIIIQYKEQISDDWKNAIPIVVAFLFIYIFDLFFTFLAGENKNDDHVEKLPFPKLTILYGTTTGNAASFAKKLKATWNRTARANIANHYDISTYESENIYEVAAAENHALVVILSTWTGGTPPETAKHFMEYLEDTANDFRRSKTALGQLAGAAVYGLGSTAYDTETFCLPAKKCAHLLGRLGAKDLFIESNKDDHVSVGLADDSVGDMDAEYELWIEKLISQYQASPNANNTTTTKKKTSSSTKKIVKRKISRKDKKKYNLQKNSKKKNQNKNSENLNIDSIEETEEDKLNDYFVEASSGVLDIEDMGGAMMEQKKSLKDSLLAEQKGELAEMVTPRQRASLTKEGYKIIGTHSAVKLCRWTKNQLRGRGGCYKHTCYGITSYQCMEATPSLACANKCTFCWRHHKNPVGTSWRWKQDEPERIVREALALHDQMVKQMKGVPGVQKERLADARTVRHCALSLVGEPIMYPRINEMLDELHKRDISTFLVTNAQFPKCIDNLCPVTQLYVSIDASTKESLQKVDRPLFKDFWERFQSSLRSLKRKKQRTVYRLTLVKAHNMDEVREYSGLVALGQPDFIEIKSVTFCGKSDASDLTFENVPFHKEVVEFASDLCKYINEDAEIREKTSQQFENKNDGNDNYARYEICSEHQHSNLVLLAKTSYKVKGKWNTWIDYPKFSSLWRKWKDSNGEFTFNAEDYMAETPYWAVYGAKERGMDPLENRYYHNRTIRRAKEGKLSKLQLSQYPINPAEIDLDARNDSNANVQLNARIIKENKANKQRQQNQHLKVKSNISLQQSSQESGSNKRSNTVNAVKTKELNGK